MCRDIERWEVNEVQIPGKKIEPQWPFLDTLEALQLICWRESQKSISLASLLRAENLGAPSPRIEHPPA